MNNFESIRSYIQVGDILLSREKHSPISKTIGTVTHSFWSHALLYIGNGKIIDAIPSGVKIRSLEEYFGGNYSVGLFRHITPLIPNQQARVVKAARKFAGLQYGWLQLGWQFILRILGKSEDPDWALDVKPGVICSEMVAKAYEAIGIKFKNIPAYQMEPVDFDESPITVRIV